MKAFGATLILAALTVVFTLVTASPALGAFSVSKGDVAIMGQGHTQNMTWVGRIFPGDTQPTTIVGDLKTVYDKIFTLNPNFEKDFADDHVGGGGPHGASFGEVADGPDDGILDCSEDVPRTTWNNCKQALHYLNTVGNGAGTCAVDAHTCSEIYCAGYCRVRVCNFEDTAFTPLCRDLATDVSMIHDACPDREAWHGLRGPFKGTRVWPGQHETHASYCYNSV